MQVLVTGGCGFIGSHVVDALVKRGDSVTVLDNLSSGKRERLNAAATLVVGDVADAAIMGRLVPHSDAVIHLAAVASVARCQEDWAASHRTNLTGTVTVFDAARRNQTPVVYASSAAVYGDNASQPLLESVAANPLSAYGLDKLTGEKQAEIGWRFHAIPSVGLRLFNVYGPRQDPYSPYSGVISKFMAAAREGQPLTFFGDGEQTRDFIYVGDVVRLVLAALEHREGALILNGCTGKAVSLKQLAAAIGNYLEKPLTTRHEPARAGDIRHSLGSPEKARELFGFVAQTALAEGLKGLAGHA